MQLGVPIPTMLSVLGVQRMGYNNYLEAACYCKRYTAHEALSANLIDYSAPLESLADKTIEVAKHYAEINAYPDALHLTKEGIYSGDRLKHKDDSIRDGCRAHICVYSGTGTNKGQINTLNFYLDNFI